MSDNNQFVDEEYLNDENDNEEVFSNISIQSYKTDMGFKTLMQEVEEGLFVVPNFQRVYRWKTHQVEELAASVVRGMPIPPIYTYRNEAGKYEILDGQQRIISLLLYYHGKKLKNTYNAHLNLKDTKIIDVLNDPNIVTDHKYIMKYMRSDEGKLVEEEKDITYQALDASLKTKVDFTIITVVEIVFGDSANKLQNLYKIFANLNSGGTPLSPQELRNGIYVSCFYDMLYEVNQNEKWRRMFGAENKEAKDIEFLLRLCAMEKIMTYDKNTIEIRAFKNYTRLLNDFSKEAVNYSVDEVSEYKEHLLKFIASIPRGFVKSFVLWEAIYLAEVVKNFDCKINKHKIFDIIDTDLYKATLDRSLSKTKAIENRVKLVIDGLQCEN